MGNVLVVAEHQHGKFPKTTLVGLHAGKTAAGKQAAGLTGGKCIAAVLGQGIDALANELAGDAKSAKVTREVDGGLETINVPLPAIVTADLRLNEPRYASLPGIMKARKKELKEIPVGELGVDVAPRLTIVKLETPPKRTGGRKVGSVQELVQVLHNEVKVI